MNALLSSKITFRQLCLFSFVIMLYLGAAIAPAHASENDTTDRDGLPNKTVPAGTY